ncbi:polyamine aminopropyltransferase [Dethiobacter alkaliphilus]|uniref:Polyamine aminopropyltransferase n=1 Tax=Dethiobacter alkaliphilus AHT 1 TaxID=555088 RepID=C0GGG8_DETAL|nr:polyamine aminopropyltransferase [Dethiobacter alkaliphilus]EEG77598.1 spermidine synthase [Dethiobacter alkaliphilus AHT 1]
MELWYTEKQTPNLGITCLVRETLCHIKTPFQDLAVIDTLQFGKMLVLDGMVQTTEQDEFVYHEMIAHIAMQAHPNPKDVLVVGGGDGGAIREVIKYDSVESATLVEIDEAVVEMSKKYLPGISVGLSDPRVNVLIADGIKHVKESVGKYDVILVDSTEPVGPAVGLFSQDFYAGIYRALKKDGMLVAQTESPFFNRDLIRSAYSRIKSVFPLTKLYLASIPTYPSGLWSFTVGSKCYEPEEGKQKPVETKYYNSAVHKGAFCLPNFVSELLEAEER